jgi:HEAT repeat protein
MYIPNLRMFKSKREVKILIRYLSVIKHSHVRQWTADILGELGDRRAVQPLIESLQDEAPNVRRSVALALGQLGDGRAVHPLIGCLQDPDAEVCRNAVEALGEIGDERAVEPLIKVLEDDAPLIQATAAEALGQIGDPAASQGLANLRDRSAHKKVKRAVAEAIDEIRASQKRAERRAKAAARSRRASRAKHRRKPSTRSGSAAQGEKVPRELSISMYIAQLGSPIREWRADASEKLCQIGRPAVKQLIRTLSGINQPEELRAGAALVLGRIGDSRARTPLKEALKDGSKDVRWAAKMGLRALDVQQGE